MITFRDLFLYAKPSRIMNMIETIEQSLSDGWRRDLDAERRLKERSIEDNAAYCFACDATPRREAALVFLKQQGAETFSVTNIVPRQSGQLSYAQYNAILKEFHDHFLDPVANQFEVRVEMTQDQQRMDSWLSQEALERLEAFSGFANKSTGLTQSNDRDRWFSFIIKAHEDESRLDPATLARWLESQSWGADIAGALADDYQRSRELLAFADAHRPVHSV